MTWDDYVKSARTHANMVLISYLTHQRDLAAHDEEVAGLNDNVEGRMYFRERKEIIDKLIKVLNPEYKKEEGCT